MRGKEVVPFLIS